MILCANLWHTLISWNLLYLWFHPELFVLIKDFFCHEIKSSLNVKEYKGCWAKVMKPSLSNLFKLVYCGIISLNYVWTYGYWSFLSLRETITTTWKSLFYKLWIWQNQVIQDIPGHTDMGDSTVHLCPSSNYLVYFACKHWSNL